MNFEDLKLNDYIHWKAERLAKGWNTFGRVISLTTDQAVILTYDDFKETIISSTGDTIKEEMTLSNEVAVRHYIALRVAKLEAQVVEQTIEFNEKVRLINENIVALRKVFP